MNFLKGLLCTGMLEFVGQFRSVLFSCTVKSICAWKVRPRRATVAKLATQKRAKKLAIKGPPQTHGCRESEGFPIGRDCGLGTRPVAFIEVPRFRCLLDRRVEARVRVWVGGAAGGARSWDLGRHHRNGAPAAVRPQRW